MKQFPPSIKEYIPLKGSGVAYLYEYTNIVNMMKYVGIHLGLPEDTYLESSKNPEFRKVMAGSEPVLIFKILQYGTYKQMQDAEQFCIILHLCTKCCKLLQDCVKAVKMLQNVVD